jgi:hypothetical protein
MQHKLWNKRLADYTLGDYTKLNLIALGVVVVPLVLISVVSDRKLDRQFKQLVEDNNE